MHENVQITHRCKAHEAFNTKYPAQHPRCCVDPSLTHPPGWLGHLPVIVHPWGPSFQLHSNSGRSSATLSVCLLAADHSSPVWRESRPTSSLEWLADNAGGVGMAELLPELRLGTGGHAVSEKVWIGHNISPQYLILKSRCTVGRKWPHTERIFLSATKGHAHNLWSSSYQINRKTGRRSHWLAQITV